MSTITAASRTPYVHWLTESRPPSLTWARPSPPESNQPLLDLIDHEQDAAEIAASQRSRRTAEYGQGALGGAASARAAGSSAVGCEAGAGRYPDAAGPASGCSAQPMDGRGGLCGDQHVPATQSEDHWADRPTHCAALGTRPASRSRSRGGFRSCCDRQAISCHGISAGGAR